MFVVWKEEGDSFSCLRFFYYFDFIEGSFSTLCKTCSWPCTKSIDKCFLSFYHCLLFFVYFEFFFISFWFFFYRIWIIAMIVGDTIFSLHFHHFGTSFIEKFSIMRDNDISTFPGIDEIVFEPLNTWEIDKIGWLVEKEKIRSREKNFCKCNLGPFSSWDIMKLLLKEMEYPYSSTHSFNLILISISSPNLILFQEIGISLIFSGLTEYDLFFFDLFLYSSQFLECISELISNWFFVIDEMNLFEVSKCHISDILNISVIFCYSSFDNLEKCTLSDSIWTDECNSISSIYDGSYISEDDFSITFKWMDIYIEMIHGCIVEKIKKKWKLFWLSSRVL